MPLLIVSFIAGILTVLAPCILPVLPLILGGSLVDKNKWRPLIITSSLAISIVVFTLILKASTLFVMIPQSVWQIVSGGIIFLFGIFTVFPHLWEKISLVFHFGSSSGTILSKAGAKKNILGTILVGAALGPVFASCSPTYFVILATVLPVSFAKGLLYLSVYALGLMLVLFVIAYLGQKAISNLRWAANPHGWFKKGLGIFFIVLAIAIISGYEKKLEIYLLDSGLFDVTKIEQKLLENIEEEEMPPQEVPISQKSDLPFLGEAPEIVGIEFWINSSGENLKDLRGKVVIIDFWTYSCINCIRTLPYLTSWHEKYQNDGLFIIGIHSPEFAFERIRSNVEDAVEEYGIQYPVGLDNKFETWRAYENHYWPAKYIIDKEGNLRYEHFGEGKYEETEEVIRKLLAEGGDEIEGEIIAKDKASSFSFKSQTPETYLGYKRAENFVNEEEFKANQIINYNLGENLSADQWSLGGEWKIEDENSISQQDEAKLKLKFNAKDVFLVMGAEENEEVTVLLDGEKTTESNRGTDVNNESIVTIKDFKLYRLIESEKFLEDVDLELVFPKGVKIYAFTFGR